MEAITSSQARIEAKLVKFKTEVWQGQEDPAARALKRARYEKPYSFKQKGNEEQASFNSKVDESLAKAEAELAEAHPSTAPSFNRALQALQKGRKLITGCQKLIKIVDRSEHGWGVVAEYTTDELAEDSDDEKRLEKAERVAEQKAAKRRKKRAGAATWKPHGLGQPGPSVSVTIGTPSLVVQSLSHPSLPKPSTLAVIRPLGRCFGCGEMGHPSAGCPKTLDSRKSYPSVVNDNVCKYIDSNQHCIKQMCVDSSFSSLELGVDGVWIDEREDEYQPWKVEVRELQNGSAHRVGPSYSGLYEEGEVDYINYGLVWPSFLTHIASFVDTVFNTLFMTSSS